MVKNSFRMPAVLAALCALIPSGHAGAEEEFTVKHDGTVPGDGKCLCTEPRPECLCGDYHFKAGRQIWKQLPQKSYCNDKLLGWFCGGHDSRFHTKCFFEACCEEVKGAEVDGSCLCGDRHFKDGHKIPGSDVVCNAVTNTWGCKNYTKKETVTWLKSNCCGERAEQKYLVAAGGPPEGSATPPRPWATAAALGGLAVSAALVGVAALGAAGRLRRSGPRAAESRALVEEAGACEE